MSSPKKRMVPDEGGKSPVTQLNSVVLPAPLEPSTAPAPTEERRWATLSMTVASAATHLGPGGTPAPALPETDHAIRRPEHDREEADTDQQAEAIAVEPDMDQEVEREGAQDDEDEGADERPDRSRDATDDGDDQDVDAALDRDRARRNLPVIPDLEHARECCDKGCECIGRDPVRVDVEAECGHAARIVTHALQGEPEWCARQVQHREIAQRR